MDLGMGKLALQAQIVAAWAGFGRRCLARCARFLWDLGAKYQAGQAADGNCFLYSLRVPGIGSCTYHRIPGCQAEVWKEERGSVVPSMGSHKSI